MTFVEIMSILSRVIETAGVAVIIIGGARSSWTFLRTYRHCAEGEAYTAFRRQFGRSIIIGLEILIAGDIIRTVVVVDTHTIQNVAVLGFIVLIRAFLSITLSLEIEGRWPWQQESNVEPTPKDDPKAS
jgi:uncharacterized membrane protein